MQHLTHSTCLVDYTCYKWEVDWRMLCAHQRWVARHFASSWRCLKMFEDVLQMITISTTFEKTWKATKLLVIYGNPMCMYIYIHTHTIYKHHISPFFRSGFASLVEPSFRFVLNAPPFRVPSPDAVLLGCDCANGPAVRSGSESSKRCKEPQKSLKWLWIVINYH